MNARKLGRPGGTSIAEEDGSAIKWLAAAVGIGVLVVVIFMLKDDDGAKQAEPAQTPAGARANQATAAEQVPVTNEDPEPMPEISNNAAAGEVASDLEADLQSKRLWSAVEVDPGASSVLTIRTAFCGEDGLKSSIGRLAGRMKEQGITKVECFTRHGTLEFERSL